MGWRMSSRVRGARACAMALGLASMTWGAACSSSVSVPETCVSSRECGPAGLVCDVGAGRCVECVVDADCLASDRVCRASACVAVTRCTSSRMCPGQVCDLAAGICVDCVVDADCRPDQVCSASACVARPMPCTSDRECSASGLVCSTTRGVCVECVRDADCPEGTCVSDRCVVGGDAGIDAGRDAWSASDSDLPRDAGPDALGPADAAMEHDAYVERDAGCGASAGSLECSSASPIGTGTVVAGERAMSAIGALLPGDSAWHTVALPTGRTAPRVELSLNEGGAYVLDVFSTCLGASGGVAASCGAAEASLGISVWEVQDRCLPASCLPTRDVPWPSQIWIRVRRVDASPACLRYQLAASNPLTSCDAMDASHCGASCFDCTARIARATGPLCSASGVCDYTSCASGASDCDGNRTNGCEAWSATACGASCADCTATFGHVTDATCSTSGFCTWTACATGYANCDGNAANGCEVMTAHTSAECCGAACTGSLTCMGSAAAGYGCR